MLQHQDSKTSEWIELISKVFPDSRVLGEKEAEPFRLLKTNQSQQHNSSYTRERLGSERASAGTSVRKVKSKNKNEGPLSLSGEDAGGGRLTAPPTNANEGEL
ncbi:MAG TPA: hypothetical protein PLK94_04640 [Alphaproteobacteria bacterium]|nr:hypothetical protein [Alphaproteobacteria bacterium]